MKYLFLLYSASLILIYSCSEGNPSGSVGPPDTKTMELNIMNDPESMPGDFDITIDSAKALISDVYVDKPGLSRKLVFKGPFVHKFRVDNSLVGFTSGAVDTGTYSRISFKFHKVTEFENPPDRDFKEGNNENQRYSFLIYYKQDGYLMPPFKFKDDLDLTVTLNQDVMIRYSLERITMVYRNRQWFRHGGTTYINPHDPANYELVVQSFLQSFAGGFRDNDKNGLPD